MSGCAAASLTETRRSLHAHDNFASCARCAFPDGMRRWAEGWRKAQLRNRESDLAASSELACGSQLPLHDDDFEQRRHGRCERKRCLHEPRSTCTARDDQCRHADRKPFPARQDFPRQRWLSRARTGRQRSPLRHRASCAKGPRSQSVEPSQHTQAVRPARPQCLPDCHS